MPVAQRGPQPQRGAAQNACVTGPPESMREDTGRLIRSRKAMEHTLAAFATFRASGFMGFRMSAPLPTGSIRHVQGFRVSGVQGVSAAPHLKDAALALVGAHELAAGNGPDVQVAVEAAAGQQLAVGREGHRVDRLRVLRQVVQARPRLRVPQPGPQAPRSAHTSVLPYTASWTGALFLCKPCAASMHCPPTYSVTTS